MEHLISKTIFIIRVIFALIIILIGSAMFISSMSTGIWGLILFVASTINIVMLMIDLSKNRKIKEQKSQGSPLS